MKGYVLVSFLRSFSFSHDLSPLHLFALISQFHSLSPSFAVSFPRKLDDEKKAAEREMLLNLADTLRDGGRKFPLRSNRRTRHIEFARGEIR